MPSLTDRLAAVALASAFTAACASLPSAPIRTAPSRDSVAIMGVAHLNVGQLVAWFSVRQPPTGTFAATVPVDTLARYFVEEGAAEGVAGDLAFVQSIVETGWFRFTGRVAASSNNFAGIGATGGNDSPAKFPDARSGVRAQIQHLRAYADPEAHTCTVPPLHHPCEDPRFHLVTPKGKAATWNQLGNGNWASSRTYSSVILALYDEARASAGIR